MAQFLLKRSGTADKRPDPAQMVIGELDLNYDAITGGIFYKNSGGTLIKVGPAQVSATAPNATPAGSAGNALGEFWYDTGASALCIWDGSAWQATGGGGGIPPSTFTACGDLIVGTGAGTYTALPIPRDFFSNVWNGCILTTCDTEASGLAWVTPPYVSSTALNASSIGALIVNGCDIGGGACITAILPGPAQPGQILTNAYNAGDPGYLAGQGYLSWCTPNFISQSSFSPGTLVVGCTPSSTGGMCTIGSLTNINNPGVQPGYYQGVTVTSCTGTGTGALATVNVINAGYLAIFDYVEVTQPGTGYALGNQVGFVICGTTVTTCGAVCSLDQTTICKAGYLPVGTNGQVLTVDSTCALGVKWAAGGGGGSGIPCSLLTATGDLIVASGANTPVALPVGVNGQILLACSTCPNGLGWASLPAATPAVSGVVRGVTNDGLTLNTALGLGSLNTSLTGERNTAVGSATLGSLTTGSRNASFGQASLAAVATGNDNTGLGYASLTNATGSDNTAVGSAAAEGVTGGIRNTAVGSCSLASATSGSSNVAVGYNAGCLITTGSQNVVIGPLTQVPNVINSCQLAIGFSATDYWLTGDCTKAIKPGAGILDCADSTGTAGQVLMSNGANAICWGTAGGGASAATPTAAGIVLGVTDATNAALGCNVLASNTGTNNTALGLNAGCDITTGSCNVALGNNAQVAVAAGDCQLAIGFSATDYWITGDSSKAIKLGGALIDCNDSVGAAGQALFTNALNGVCWDYLPACINPDLLCCSNASGCGANGGNLITGSYGDGNITPTALYPGEPNQILTIDPSCNVNPVKWCKANFVCGACFSKGALAVGCNQVGAGVQSLTCVAPNNPGVGPGYYTDVAINGGSGTGLTANLNIINVGYFSSVDSVEVVNPGSGYLGSDSGMTATIGGTTLSTTFSVASLNTSTLVNYSYLSVGTDGQVLTADSTCTNGVKWATAGGGASIPCSVISGKGALVTGTAASTPTALSVGTNGQILIACSDCTTGLYWGPNTAGTVSAASPTAQGIVYGKYDAGTAYPDTAWDYVAYGYNAGAVFNQVNQTFAVTALGNCAAQCNVDWYSTMVGWCAGWCSFREECSVMLGVRAGAISCGTTAVNGEPVGNNVYVGYDTGCDSCGGYNTYVGSSAGKFTIGACNTFIGAHSGTYFGAMCADARICSNVAIGPGAGSALGLTAASTSTANVFIGNGAGDNSLSGSSNIAIGNNSQAGSTSSQNIGIGLNAGSASATGNNNLAIGVAAGSAVTTATNTIIIGCCAGTTTGGVSGAITTQANRIVMGNSAHTCAQIQIAWSTTSDVRDKALDPAGVPYGLLFVEQLEPIAYRFCNRETNEVTDEKLRYGFSAQNIRALEGDEAVITSDENPDKLTITDQHLLPVLVNAIKELSERNKLLEERIAALEDKA